MPELDHPDVNPDVIPPKFRNDNQGEVVVVDMVRNRLLENMPLPTARELRLMQRRN